MPVTDVDVIQAAIDDLGADFSQYNFNDDATFKAWLQATLDRIQVQFQDLIGTVDVTKPKHFDACQYELESFMLHRLVNQYYSGVLTSESITLGPLALAPLKNEPVAKDIVALADIYHRRAMAKLGAAGAPGRKGAIRVYDPGTKGNRITVI